MSASIKNEPTKQKSADLPAEAGSDVPSNYEVDFFAWTRRQAALLRQGRFSELDVENLVEEIETLGRSEKRELESRLRVLLTHLLKWQFQAQQHERYGRSWLATIRNQRAELRKLIRDNPSLKSSLGATLFESYRDACYIAEAETGLPIKTFPENCPYAIDQVLDADWMPDAFA